MLLQPTKQFCKKEYTNEIWFTSECSIALPLGTGGLNYLVRKRWSLLVPRTVPLVLSAEHYKNQSDDFFLLLDKDTKVSEKKRETFCRRCLVSGFHLKVSEELLTISYLATTWANFYFSSQAVWNGLSLWFHVKYAAKIAVLDYRLSGIFKPSFTHSPLQQELQFSDQAHKHYCRT